MSREWIFSAVIVIFFVALNAWEQLYQWARFTVNGQICVGVVVFLALIVTYVWLSENHNEDVK